MSKTKNLIPHSYFMHTHTNEYARELLSTREMNFRDQQTIASGISELELVQRAAEGVFNLLKKDYRERLRSGCTLLMCGPGNNGADGLALAQRMHRGGYRVVAITAKQPKAGSTNEYVLQCCLDDGVPVLSYSQSLNFDSLPKFFQRKYGISLIIDALLGTGQESSPKSEVKELCMLATRLFKLHNARYVSIDVPTGLCADTGRVLLDTVDAIHLIAVDSIKRGLVQYPALGLISDISVVDIGLLHTKCSEFTLSNSSVFFNNPRVTSAHKGESGKIAIIGGSSGMAGAPLLSAIAAQSAGAGLVHVFTAGSASDCTSYPQLMIEAENEECFSTIHIKRIVNALKKFDTVLIGPGLGRKNDTIQFVREVIKSFNGKIIVDADALPALAAQQNSQQKMIITPHPKEAAELLKTDVASIQEDRYEAIMQLSKLFSTTVILKGQSTIIYGPEGGRVLAGTYPLLACAGSGDVLSGIVASRVALNISLIEASTQAVTDHVHTACFLSDRKRNYPSALDLAYGCGALFR